MKVIINAVCETLPHDCTPIANAGHFYQNILTCLGYSHEAPPVADLLRRVHGLDGEWYVLSPMHWQATHNDALIVLCDEALPLSDEASRQWFAVVSDFLSEVGMTLYYHDAYTWLLQPNQNAALTAKPVQALVQQSLMPALSAMDSTGFWPRFITEMQMFLSGHPMNATRASSRSFNGVWVWGGGALGARVDRVLFCDESTNALGEILSTNVCPFEGKMGRDDLIILSDASHFSSSNNPPIHWYWNNTAYITEPKTWLARIRKFFRED